MNERTYRCTLCLCHKTVISAEGKMTGQLISCLAHCVLLLSLSLISILGSEILMALYLLSLLSLLSILFLFACALFVSYSSLLSLGP